MVNGAPIVSVLSVQKHTKLEHFPSKSTEKAQATAPLNSALRLELRPGELVLWDGPRMPTRQPERLSRKDPGDRRGRRSRGSRHGTRDVPYFQTLRLNKRLETRRDE